MSEVDEVDAEDAKLVTLARAAAARLGAAEAAAVRDDTGRTYVAGPVHLPSLRLAALQAAVAAAVSSGAARLEAAAIVGDGEPQGLDAAADLMLPGGPVLIADRAGSLRERR
jgi:hypothetical protein